jgi:membrane protease YdiL (CAAX protease family)
MMEFIDKDRLDDREVVDGARTYPVWNWKLALATLGLFSLGVVLLIMLQARLLSDRFGTALLDPGNDVGLTTRVILVTFFGLTAVGIGSIWLVIVVWGKRTWRDLGFRPLSRKWQQVSMWLAIGLVVVRVLIGTLLAVRYPALTEGMEDMLFTAENDLLTTIAVLILVAFVIPIWEELFFRGFLYKWSRNRLGMWAAISLNALLFGVFHLIPLQILLAAMMGFALAWIYERSDSLWAPILMHMINNLIVGVSSVWLIFMENGLI